MFLYEEAIYEIKPRKALQMNYSIRQLNEKDAQAFQCLRRDIVQGSEVPIMGLSHDEELGRSIDGVREQLSLPTPCAAFGAFVEAELIGNAGIAWTSSFPSSRHKATLWGVFVHPKTRNGGIGRALTLRAVEHAFANNARRVNCQVFVPNLEAVTLYKSLGFVVCGTEPEAVYLNGKYYDGLYMTLYQSAA